MRLFLSRLLGICLILLLLGGVLVALLPSLASTDWGRKQVVYWTNRSIPGTLEIRSLNLHWGDGQVVEGLLLKDPQGHAVLEFEKLSTEATLWQLLKKSTHLGYTQIVDLNAAIQSNAEGSTNLHSALGIDGGTNRSNSLFPSSIVLSDVNIDLYLFSKDKPLSALIKGSSRQDKLNGSFEFTLALRDFEASNWKELRKDVQQYLTIEGSKDATIQARVTNFPVDLIDRVVSLFDPKLNGLFHSLLGDRLNLTIEKESSQEGLAFNLSAQTPLMQGNLKGKIANNLVSLQEPGIFQFQISPDFVNPFVDEKLKLLNASLLKVTLQAMSFPLDILDTDASVDACQVELKTQLGLPKTDLEIPSFGALSLLNLQANLNSQACAKNISFDLKGKGLQGLESFEFFVDSQIAKPTSLSNGLREILESLQAKISVSHFPLQMIPQLQKQPELLDIVGSTLDSLLRINSNEQGTFEAVLTLRTPKLELKEAKFQVDDTLSLVNPAQLNLTLSKNCLSSILHNPDFILSQPCTINTTLKTFRIPLDNLMQGKIQLQSTASAIQLPQLHSLGALLIQDIAIKLEGNDLSHITSNLQGKFSLLDVEGTISPLLQDPVSFAFSSKWEVENGKKVSMPSGTLELHNSILNAEFEGRLPTLDTFELTEPTQISYLLSPSALDYLSQLLEKEFPKLRDPSSIKFTLYPVSLSLKAMAFSSLKLKGALAIDLLHFEDTAGTHPHLEKIELPWEINAPENSIAADLKGLIYAPSREKMGAFTSHVQLWPTQGKFDIAQTRAEVHMNFDGMPTSLISSLFTQEDLSSILGPILDLNFRTFIDPTREKPGYFDLSLDASNFHVQGRFKLNHVATIYEENKVPNFRLNITPENFEKVKKILGIASDYKLANPVTISGQMPRFNVPLKQTWADQAMIDLQVATTDIAWANASSVPLKFEGRLQSQNISDQIQFNFKTGITQPLILQGTLSNLFFENGSLKPWSSMAIQANLEGKKLTPDVITSLLVGNREIANKTKALFGDTLDLTLSTQVREMNGQIRATIVGPQAQISFDGNLRKGLLTLNKPLEGEVTLTPLFTQTFLVPHAPLLGTAVGSEKPIKFSLATDQFSCPLLPFKLEQVKIGKGMLDLGKIKFKNEGELSSALSFIHSIAEPYFTIWFTPLYFNLDKGILNLKRVDLLVANSYTLASWGNLNLVNQQADLVLGLSGQSLLYAFGVQGLDDDYLLQVPLRTANGKVEIDKKKATGRITSLIAQTQGGIQGKILGNILDVALSTNGEATPPPATKPFPWKDSFTPSTQNTKNQETSSSQSSDSSEVKKKKKKKKDNPIKDVQEGAIELLDNIFGG